jgi:hypothetical protein
MRSKFLAGLTTAVAAVAIAAPAAHAQEVIPPAQPSTPTLISPAQPAEPAAPTMGWGDKCTVTKSRHGYVYATCPFFANNIPYGETVSLSYKANLHTFKPRTNGTWSNGTGTVSITNSGAPGTGPGTVSNLTQNVKMAFKNKDIAKVRKDLIIAMTGQSGNAGVVNPVIGA